MKKKEGKELRKEKQRRVIGLTIQLKQMTGLEPQYDALWNERADLVRVLNAETV